MWTPRNTGAGQAPLPAQEQAERQAWWAPVLVLKAKLEAVEAGLTTLEQEFLAGHGAARGHHGQRGAAAQARGP